MAFSWNTSLPSQVLQQPMFRLIYCHIITKHRKATNDVICQMLGGVTSCLSIQKQGLKRPLWTLEIPYLWHGKGWLIDYDVVRLCLRTAATNEPTVHPLCDMWAWKAMVVMMLAGDNSWLVHQSSLAVLPAESSGASTRNGRSCENFAYQYLKYLKGPLTCRNILHTGPPALLPIQRKVCSIFLLPLQIHCIGWVWTCDPWVQQQAH
jgi:hypothetical protein